MTNAIARTDVMSRAWEIARRAVAEFGGRVREFFSESLRQAWMEFKTVGQVVNMDLASRVKAYKMLKIMQEELQSEMDKIKDTIIADMRGESKMTVEEFKISYADAKRETLDKKRLEADLGDLTEYTKTTVYKVFKVA